MKYSIVTFGCRVNQADSLRLEEDLRAHGAIEASSSEADLVIVNTCSVTATADQGARQTIRRIARENPGARIFATGCYATRCDDEVAALPNVVRVVRNDEKLDLVRALRASEPRERSGAGVPASERAGEFEGRSPSIDHDGPCGTPIEPGVAGRTAFTIRAQTGCEEACAFCIIPKTRGASRSLPIDVLVDDVRRVANAGFKEVAVAGVHLGSYGRDLTPRTSLLDLLTAFAAVDADVTYRISSLEPMDCTPEIVNLVARGGRFLPHFHLPLQHASDRLLAAMRRPYTLDYYRRLVDDIHARLPHASIGSDMIVGFPGETDDDFAANLAYLPSSPLTHLHVFPYSDRPGTEATRMRDKVHGSVIRDRGAQLRRIGSDLSSRFRASQAGTIRPGLTLEDGTLVVTDNYLKVRIAPGLVRNQRVFVRLEAETTGVCGVSELLVPDAQQNERMFARLESEATAVCGASVKGELLVPDAQQNERMFARLEPEATSVGGASVKGELLVPDAQQNERMFARLESEATAVCGASVKGELLVPDAQQMAVASDSSRHVRGSAAVRRVVVPATGASTP